MGTETRGFQLAPFPLRLRAFRIPRKIRNTSGVVFSAPEACPGRSRHDTEPPGTARGRIRRGGAMNTGLEPPLHVGEDDASRALVSIIAITRRHWRLPPDPVSWPHPSAATAAGTPPPRRSTARPTPRRPG